MEKIILLDNGHGIQTPGKRSPDNSLLEYKYTREIAKLLKDKLVDSGIDCRLVTPEDIDIPLSIRTSRINKVCDEYGKENVIVVSIHCNAASNGVWKNARGWSAYTSKGHTKSDILTEEIYKVAYEELKEYSSTFEESELKRNQRPIRIDKSDKDCDYEENFWILQKSKCIAVLTENMFMDNKKDVEFLLSDKGKETIVNIHYKGILNYINQI